MNLRQRVWDTVQTSKAGDRVNRVFIVFIVSLIFLNLIAVIVGSVRWVEKGYGKLLDGFEVFSIVIFTIEYIARVWSCTSNPDFSRPIVGRLRYIATPMALIDLLAILPFYIPFLNIDLRVVRSLRFFRIIRVAKLGRYSSSIQLFRTVFQAKKEELLMALMMMLLLIVIASSCIYFTENSTQPDKFPDIPSSMWWAVITLTTVGYGDVFPVTTVGKFITAIIAVLGVGMVALPAGILGAGFVEEIQKRKAAPKHCPHCGKEITH